MYKIVTIGMNSCTKQSPPKYQRRRKKTRIEGRKTNGLYNYYVNVLCVRTNLAVVVLKADIWGCINVYVIYVIPFTTTNTKEPSFNCHAVYLIFSFSFIRISSMPVFGSASTQLQKTHARTRTLRTIFLVSLRPEEISLSSGSVNSFRFLVGTGYVQATRYFFQILNISVKISKEFY